METFIRGEYFVRDGQRSVWSTSQRGVVVLSFIVLPLASSPHSPCSTLSSSFLFLFFCPLAYSSLVTLNRSLRLHLCNCVCSVTREIVVAGVFASVSFISSPSCELRVCQWRNDRYSKTRNIEHIELGNRRVYIDDSIETRALSSVSRCQGSSLNERCFYPRQLFSTFHLW